MDGGVHHQVGDRPSQGAGPHPGGQVVRRLDPHLGPGADRALGALFGTARGLLLVILIIAGAGLTVLDREPWWQSSVLIQSLEPYAAWAREQLPREWVEDIQPSDGERAAVLAPLAPE
mgnify:CR=1 FL=1